MKIKIILPVILFSVLIASEIRAQEKEALFYVKVYGGDGLLTPGSDGLYPSAVYYVQNGSNGSYSYSKKGLGAGINNGFGLEKALGKVFTVGLDVNFLHGQTLSSSYSVFPPPSANINYATYNGNAAYSVTSFIPNVSAKIFQKPGYFIYTRLGVTIAMNVKYKNGETYIIQGNGTIPAIENLEQVNKYGTDLGLNTAIGVRFKLFGPLGGFAELSGNLLSVSPKSATLDGTINEGGSPIYIHDDITYIKSTSGFTSFNSGASGNGNGGGSILATDTERSFNQHINNIVVNIGLALAIK